LQKGRVGRRRQRKPCKNRQDKGELAISQRKSTLPLLHPALQPKDRGTPTPPATKPEGIQLPELSFDGVRSKEARWSSRASQSKQMRRHHRINASARKTTSRIPDPPQQKTASSSAPWKTSQMWGWSSGKLILCSAATATQATLPETLSLALFTGQTRGPEVLPTSRRPRDGRRRGEPQDSPADDGAREVAFLFASLDCSKGKGKGKPAALSPQPEKYLVGMELAANKICRFSHFLVRMMGSQVEYRLEIV
jgi:hypothetical protein